MINYYIENGDLLSDTLYFRILNYFIEVSAPHPQLHDELLVQMCKQTLKNPDE